MNKQANDFRNESGMDEETIALIKAGNESLQNEPDELFLQELDALFDVLDDESE
ncbi:MAG: hypothetical protein JEY79_16320 [Pseudodesulfovibrio sp.]|nr:hypothetical protein [Pseudodesulfovibrio sp.]